MGIIKGITSIKHDLSGVNTSDSTSVLSAGMGKRFEELLLGDFYVNLTLSGSVTFDTNPKVIVFNQGHNPGGFYNTTSGIFTAPTAGFYRFEATVNNQTGDTGVILFLKFTDGISRKGNVPDSDVGYLMVEIELEANDQVSLQFLGTPGLFIGSEFSRIMIRRLF